MTLPNRVSTPINLCILALLGMGGMSACSDSATQRASSAEVSQHAEIRAVVAWRTKVGDQSTLDLRPAETAGLAVDRANSVVVVASNSGDLVGLNGGDGVQMWASTLGEAIIGAPVIDGSIAFVGVADGTLRAISIVSGAELFRTQLGAMVHGTPIVRGGTVYVADASESLHAIDRSTGETLWSHVHERYSSLDVRGGPTPSIYGDDCYVGYSDGAIYKLDATTGAVVWAADLSNGADELRDVDSAPLLVGGTLFASSYSGGLFALNPETGSILWHREELVSDAPIATVNRRLLSVAGGDTVSWIDPETGETTQQLELGGRGLAGPYAITEDYAAVVDSQIGMRIIDTTVPLVHSEFRPDGGVDAAPVVQGDSMFLLSNHGFVYRLRLYRL